MRFFFEIPLWGALMSGLLISILEMNGVSCATCVQNLKNFGVARGANMSLNKTSGITFGGA